MTGWRLFYHQFLGNKLFGKNKNISVQVDNILDKIVLLSTNQNAASVVVMILLGPTSSELAFSAFDISGSSCL